MADRTSDKEKEDNTDEDDEPQVVFIVERNQKAFTDRQNKQDKIGGNVKGETTNRDIKDNDDDEKSKKEEKKRTFLVGQNKVELVLEPQILRDKSTTFRNLLQLRSQAEVGNVKGKDSQDLPIGSFQIQDTKNQNGDDLPIIYLQTIEPKELQTIVKFLNGEDVNWTEEFSMDEICRIWYFSQTFKVPDLFHKISAFFASSSSSPTSEQSKQVTEESPINDSTVCQIFQEGKINVKHSKADALNHILKNAGTILEQDEFLELTSDSLKEIIGHDELQVENEVQVFQAVLRWGQNQCKKQGIESTRDNLRMALKEIVPLVRFPLMSESQLALSVYPSDLLDDAQWIAVNNAIEYCKNLPYRAKSVLDINARLPNTKLELTDIQTELLKIGDLVKQAETEDVAAFDDEQIKELSNINSNLKSRLENLVERWKTLKDTTLLSEITTETTTKQSVVVETTTTTTTADSKESKSTDKSSEVKQCPNAKDFLDLLKDHGSLDSAFFSIKWQLEKIKKSRDAQKTEGALTDLTDNNKPVKQEATKNYHHELLFTETDLEDQLNEESPNYKADLKEYKHISFHLSRLSKIQLKFFQKVCTRLDLKNAMITLDIKVSTVEDPDRLYFFLHALRQAQIIRLTLTGVGKLLDLSPPPWTRSPISLEVGSPIPHTTQPHSIFYSYASPTTTRASSKKALEKDSSAHFALGLQSLMELQVSSLGNESHISWLAVLLNGAKRLTRIRIGTLGEMPSSENRRHLSSSLTDSTNNYTSDEDFDNETTSIRQLVLLNQATKLEETFQIYNLKVDPLEDPLILNNRLTAQGLKIKYIHVSPADDEDDHQEEEPGEGQGLGKADKEKVKDHVQDVDPKLDSLSLFLQTQHLLLKSLTGLKVSSSNRQSKTTSKFPTLPSLSNLEIEASAYWLFTNLHRFSGMVRLHWQENGGGSSCSENFVRVEESEEEATVKAIAECDHTSRKLTSVWLMRPLGQHQGSGSRLNIEEKMLAKFSSVYPNIRQLNCGVVHHEHIVPILHRLFPSLTELIVTKFYHLLTVIAENKRLLILPTEDSYLEDFLWFKKTMKRHRWRDLGSVSFGISFLLSISAAEVQFNKNYCDWETNYQVIYDDYGFGKLVSKLEDVFIISLPFLGKELLEKIVRTVMSHCLPRLKCLSIKIPFKGSISKTAVAKEMKYLADECRGKFCLCFSYWDFGKIYTPPTMFMKMQHMYWY